MSVFVAVDQIEKVFPLADGGKYIALKGIDLQIKKGEFVSLIGHSGCGKSTLLNMIAGLDLPSEGLVTLEGQRIKEPGPDRMVVFQNYSLLPWRTVRENIALAVNSVMKDMPAGDRKAIVEQHIDMVGLRPHADKQPGMLSGWTKTASCDRTRLSHSPQIVAAG
jgi:bicarbonate transport system ATP-binding protein